MIGSIQDLEAVLARVVREQLAGRDAAVAALLGGYQSALMAILQTLDASGVLPATAAKAAIDGAYALLSAAQQASGQGTVLRQLSEGLAAPRRRRRPVH